MAMVKLRPRLAPCVSYKADIMFYTPGDLPCTQWWWRACSWWWKQPLKEVSLVSISPCSRGSSV